MLSIGTPAEVGAYCTRLIDEVGAGSGFILGSGCSVPSGAKPENFRVMIETGKRHRTKGGSVFVRRAARQRDRAPCCNHAIASGAPGEAFRPETAHPARGGVLCTSIPSFIVT
jgi:hypothetical protein